MDWGGWVFVGGISGGNSRPDGLSLASPPGAGGLEQKGPAPGKDPDGALSDSDCKEALDDAPSKGAPGCSPPLAHCVPGRLLLQAHQQLQAGGGGEDPQAPHPLTLQYRPPSAELHPILPSSKGTSVIHSPQPPAQAAALSKPKLWSLAEIATSADKAKEGGGGHGGGEAPLQAPPGLGAAGASQSPPSRSPSAAQCPFPNSAAVLSRPLYYTSPFYPGYTNYGSFGHLHSAAGAAGNGTPHFNGLNQTLLNRAEALAKETKLLRSQSQLELCKDSPYELKKGTSHI